MFRFGLSGALRADQSPIANIALLGCAMFAAFILLEISLRLLYPAPARFIYPQERYEFDQEMGFVLRPSQVAYTHDRPVSINTLGLRDGEISAEIPPGTVRVIALGDSQTFGNGLDLSDTWPKQLEHMLHGRGRYRWEVVNAGLPGTDTWQHEILLRRLLDVIHPHVVVLALYVNDVATRPDHPLDNSSATNTWSKRVVYWLKRSLVATWMYDRLRLAAHSWGLARENSLEDIVIGGGSNHAVERGWSQVKHSLAVMKELCDARNAMLFLAVLPRRDQVSGQNRGQAYDDRASKLAEAVGIEAVDLLPGLAAAYRVSGETLFIPWDGHNSAAANQVIAAAIARALDNQTTRLSRFGLGTTPPNLAEQRTRSGGALAPTAAQER